MKNKSNQILNRFGNGISGAIEKSKTLNFTARILGITLLLFVIGCDSGGVNQATENTSFIGEWYGSNQTVDGTIFHVRVSISESGTFVLGDITIDSPADPGIYETVAEITETKIILTSFGDAVLDGTKRRQGPQEWLDCKIYHGTGTPLRVKLRPSI